VLIARGDALLATGDVTAARLMYRRAADAQSVAGTVAMGMTFDPGLLAQIRVQGLAADPQLAAMWYQRAAGLGSPEAVRLLRELRDEDAERTGLSVSATHRSDPGR
jgi:TPR repeat protein